MEQYDKKEVYEYCELRRLMVRLIVIRSTVSMDDFVQAELKLLPIDCSNASNCKRAGVSCIVFDQNGRDPCRQEWRDQD